MTESTPYNPLYRIILILSLLVVFIVGFSMYQQFYNKPIIKTELNLNIVDNKSSENFSPNIKFDMNSLEKFGNINAKPNTYLNEQYKSNIISGLISDKTAEILLEDTNQNKQDSNFNNLNNIPVLISPDPPGPNQVPSSSPAYFTNRVKLVNNPDSPLLKLYNKNYTDLENKASSCNMNSRKYPAQVNGTFDGYNGFENLNTDSYANVTSIGKDMLTPYTSFPVPS